MNQVVDNPITGVYVGLRRSPLRIVFRRRVDSRWDRYDLYKPWEKIDVVVEVLKQFAKEQEDFTQSFVEVDKKYQRSSSHRTNRYVDTDRDNLYTPQRSDLVSKYSRRVGPLWLATNLNMRQMLDVIQEACEAAKVEFRTISDLKL